MQNKVRTFTVGTIVVILYAGTAIADKKVVDTNASGSYGSGDHIQIFISDTIDPALAAQHKVRVVFASEKDQNRELHEQITHPHERITHIEKVGSVVVDIDETAETSSMILQPRYQGALGQWYDVNVNSRVAWRVDNIKWGATVTFHWLQPDPNLDENGSPKKR